MISESIFTAKRFAKPAVRNSQLNSLPDLNTLCEYIRDN